VGRNAHSESVIISWIGQRLPRSWRGWLFLVAGVLAIGLVVAGFATRWSAAILGIIAIVVAVPPSIAAIAGAPARRPDTGSGAVSEQANQTPNNVSPALTDTWSFESEAPIGRWDPALNPVVTALATAIPNVRAIRTLARQSDLSLAELDPSGDLYDRWHDVVEQANMRGQEHVDTLLRLALARSPDPELHQGAALYWEQRRKRSA